MFEENPNGVGLASGRPKRAGAGQNSQRGVSSASWRWLSWRQTRWSRARRWSGARRWPERRSSTAQSARPTAPARREPTLGATPERATLHHCSVSAAECRRCTAAASRPYGQRPYHRILVGPLVGHAGRRGSVQNHDAAAGGCRRARAAHAGAESARGSARGRRRPAVAAEAGDGARSARGFDRCVAAARHSPRETSTRSLAEWKAASCRQRRG